jgi:hypothetical protein
VVNVAVSPHNRKRVMIDVGQGSKGSKGTVGQMSIDRAATARTFMTSTVDTIRDTGPASDRQPSSPDGQRIDNLAKLGQLHSQGVLTDAEFATEKARILGE